MSKVVFFGPVHKPPQAYRLSSGDEVVGFSVVMTTPEKTSDGETWWCTWIRYVECRGDLAETAMRLERGSYVTARGEMRAEKVTTEGGVVGMDVLDAEEIKVVPGATPGIPKLWANQLLKLCHPDKHGHSTESVEVTNWLLGQLRLHD